ncbi:unnamed protein product [Caenorhabditis auriculariae]|uniref:Uncharacterized protein n=1 Tax=Caenorhabditis auriculariae TaxID=2777116 RepID=A0A8S1H2I0_9PELO|nr:unnamed protein product [Caenorhabditis auriculariae]
MNSKLSLLILVSIMVADILSTDPVELQKREVIERKWCIWCSAYDEPCDVFGPYCMLGTECTQVRNYGRYKWSTKTYVYACR